MNKPWIINPGLTLILFHFGVSENGNMEYLVYKGKW
jgi:hypothetical protein